MCNFKSMEDDYLKNYMRKRTGGFWPALIILAILALLAFIDWLFDLGWFQ